MRLTPFRASVTARPAVGLLLAAFCALQLQPVENLRPVSQADAINLGSCAPSYDGAYYCTAYPNGDKPEPSCETPAGWTQAALGSGFGEICDESGDFDMNGGGLNSTTSLLMIYQDGGADDVQVICQFDDPYAGATSSLASVGCGIRELATASGYLAQCQSANSGSAVLEFKYGSDNPFTTVAGAADQERPRYCGVAYDKSTCDIVAAGSVDGSEWVEIGRTNHCMDPATLAWAHVMSKSLTEALRTTIKNPALSSTITIYEPETPPVPTAPELVSPILNQTAAQGDVFALSCAANFTGATSFSIPANGSAGGLPSSTGISFNTSTCAFSGTFAAADVGSRNITVTATNAAGSTPDTFSLTVTAPQGGGSVFTIPDVGDSADSSYNCGSNTATGSTTWASLRTSGSASRPGAGDTILITSGTRGDTQFSNCRGTDASRIVFKKTASATRLSIAGNQTSAGSGIFLFTNTVGIELDFLSNWTGHTGGCGFDPDNIKVPKTDCGLLITGPTGYNGLRFKGERRHIRIKGIEIDGEWPGPGSGAGMDQGVFLNDQAYCPQAPAAAPTSLSDTSTNWVEGIELTDSYIHDIEGPATYWGLNITVSCGGGTNTLPNLRDIYMARNYFADLGSNGVHIKRIPGSDPTTAIVEDMYVARVGGNNAGTAEGANNKPYACYEASCTIRNSYSDTTVEDTETGPGFSCTILHRPTNFGTQVCDFYNLVTWDAAGFGVNGSRGNPGETAAMETRFHNITVVNPGSACVNMASSISAGYVRNVLCAGNTKINTNAGQSTGGNVTHAAASSAGFEDLSGDDYRITSGSAARNAGISASCPSTDILGVSRPQQGTCDAGAFEYAP